MGTDIMLDTDGDAVVSPLGDLQIIDDEQELIQMAVNNIKTVYGEYFADTERGNMAFQRRMKLTSSALGAIQYDCRVAILKDSRVVEVPTIVAERSGLYGCIIDFTLKDRYGRIINSTTQITM